MHATNQHHQLDQMLLRCHNFGFRRRPFLSPAWRMFVPWYYTYGTFFQRVSPSSCYSFQDLRRVCLAAPVGQVAPFFQADWLASWASGLYVYLRSKCLWNGHYLYESVRSATTTMCAQLVVFLWIWMWKKAIQSLGFLSLEIWNQDSTSRKIKSAGH